MTIPNMRRLMMIVEGRETDNPDVSYALAGSTKAKTAAEEFSKITAKVSGRTSESFTKLAKKLMDIEMLNKQIGQLRDEVSADAKTSIEDLFDAEDEVYTRYIDTVSLSITMSKSIEESSTETSALNVDGFLEDLMILVDGNLRPAVELLLSNHTKVSTKIRAAQKGRVTTKLPILEDNVSTMVANFISTFTGKVMKFVTGYDRKLDAIATKYNLT
jgi:hypothetical protein